METLIFDFEGIRWIEKEKRVVTNGQILRIRWQSEDDSCLLCRERVKINSCWYHATLYYQSSKNILSSGLISLSQVWSRGLRLVWLCDEIEFIRACFTQSAKPYFYSARGVKIFIFSKIQIVVYYQCCVLIDWATTRLYVIAH